MTWLDSGPPKHAFPSNIQLPHGWSPTFQIFISSLLNCNCIGRRSSQRNGVDRREHGLHQNSSDQVNSISSCHPWLVIHHYFCFYLQLSFTLLIFFFSFLFGTQEQEGNENKVTISIGLRFQGILELHFLAYRSKKKKHPMKFHLVMRFETGHFWQWTCKNSDFQHETIWGDICAFALKMNGIERFFLFELYFRNDCCLCADDMERINMYNWQQFTCCSCALWKHGTWFQKGMVCCHTTYLFCSIGIIVIQDHCFQTELIN